MPTMEAELQRRVGRHLRRDREEQGLSQEAFAVELGVHRTYMGSIERGERKLSLQSVEWLADAIGLDSLDLLAK